MKLMPGLLSSFAFTLVCYAMPAGAVTSNGKAAELAAHRIDRLVSLGKIDATFMKKMETIEVNTVSNQAPVNYIVRVSQTKPPQGAPLQVDISMDKDGKPLGFKLITGGVAGPDEGWTDKDAVSLSENVLHYLLENSSDAKIAPFDQGLASLVLTKGNLNGSEVAQGQVTSALTKSKLNVYLKLDGTFISAEVAE